MSVGAKMVVNSSRAFSSKCLKRIPLNYYSSNLDLSSCPMAIFWPILVLCLFFHEKCQLFKVFEITGISGSLILNYFSKNKN